MYPRRNSKALFCYQEASSLAVGGGRTEYQMVCCSLIGYIKCQNMNDRYLIGHFHCFGKRGKLPCKPHNLQNDGLFLKIPYCLLIHQAGFYSKQNHQDSVIFLLCYHWWCDVRFLLCSNLYIDTFRLNIGLYWCGVKGFLIV